MSAAKTRRAAKREPTVDGPVDRDGHPIIGAGLALPVFNALDAYAHSRGLSLSDAVKRLLDAQRHEVGIERLREHLERSRTEVEAAIAGGTSSEWARGHLTGLEVALAVAGGRR